MCSVESKLPHVQICEQIRCDMRHFTSLLLMEGSGYKQELCFRRFGPWKAGCCLRGQPCTCTCTGCHAGHTLTSGGGDLVPCPADDEQSGLRKVEQPVSDHTARTAGPPSPSQWLLAIQTAEGGVSGTLSGCTQVSGGLGGGKTMGALCLQMSQSGPPGPRDAGRQLGAQHTRWGPRASPHFVPWPTGMS